MSNSHLPEGFENLEPYIDWSLASERDRIAKRVASQMEDIIEFHGAVSKQLEAIIVFLNQYPYDDLPEDGQRLCDMALSLVEVAPLVEMYKDPANLYMVDPERFIAYQ